MKVLLAGVDAAPDALAERLPGVELLWLEPSDPPDPAAAADALAGCAAAVLSLAAHDALAAAGVTLDLPVICCLDASTPTEVLRGLTERGVQRLMFEPVDVIELAREVGRVTGRGPAPTAAETADSGLAGEIASVWAEFRDALLGRVYTLEDVGALLLDDRRDASERAPALEEARTAAHKLHGSLGTFGQLRASALAAELETIAERGAPTEGDVFRYAELVEALRHELEGAAVELPAGAESRESTESRELREAAAAAGGAALPRSRPQQTAERGTARTRALVLEPDADRAEAVVAAALARGWEPTVVPRLEEVAGRLEQRRPDVLILDPVAEGAERVFAYVRQLALDAPGVPVVIWTDDATLDGRLRATSVGVDALVERHRDAGALVGRAAALLREVKRPPATVLVVDDDPAILGLARAALDGSALRVVTIDDPRVFWETAEATSPDLVLLDIEMPHVSGIQLCRVVRASARWAGLPIVMLTATVDQATITRAFRAGADDYVVKPISGPELRSRVLSRLDRIRLHRRAGEADPGTGALARASAIDRAAMAFALARRHGERVTVGLLRIEAERGEDVSVPLSRLAGDIRDAARPEDVVAWWSAAELLVCLYGMTGPDAAAWLEARLATDPDAPWEVRVETATFPADGRTLDELLEAAARSAARMGYESGGAGDGETRVEAARVDVVLVEDDEALAALLLQTLAARDYSTRWIADGAEAARQLAGEDPMLVGRVILLDIGLPGLDGLTVLRRLAESGVTGRSRVVMLTARAAEPEVLRSLELGAFDHVPKPFSVAELLHRVRRAVDSGDRRT